MLNLSAELDQAAFEPLDTVVQQAQLRYGASASSVMVIRNDRIVYEQYHGFHHHKQGARPVTEQSLFNIYSIRKTYICLATAIACLDHQVSLTTPLREILRDYPGDDLGELTIRDLAVGSGPKFYNQKRWEREGIQGLVVHALTGQSIADYLAEQLLRPMGCNETLWAVEPTPNLVCDYATADNFATVRLESSQGHERNMYVSTREMAKWGYLHPSRGHAGGSGLLPKEYFDMSDQMQEQCPDHRILGWYHQKEWSYATGAAGCHCVVFPEYNAVAVRMLNKYTDRYAEDQIEFNNAMLQCLKRASVVSAPESK